MSVFQGSETSESYRVTRLRNDSYLGAIHRENLLVRAGLQVCNIILLYNAVHNVFIIQQSFHAYSVAKYQHNVTTNVLVWKLAVSLTLV